MDLFLSMIVDRWWALKSNFFCLGIKDVDLRAFHFQRRVLEGKGGYCLRPCLFLLLQLNLRCFFFNLYLIFFFLFLSVLDVIKGTEVFRGVVLGVGLSGPLLSGVLVQRLDSWFRFLFLIFLKMLVVFAMSSVN